MVRQITFASIPCADPKKDVPSLPWPVPSPGYVALSVDGSFQASDSSAAAGMVLQDHEG